MEIFKLIGSIMVDSTEANKSISKTEKNAEGMGKKLSDGVKTAGKWAAGLTAAAVSVGAAMVAAAKGTASDLDVIDKGSQRMGITAERYQELAYAAGLCGVEMSTMEKAAKKLEGTDINMDEALKNIMSIGDESLRTQAAIDYFGESVAYQLQPLLNAGSEGLEAMTQEAHDLGIVMSGEAVSAGASMNDMFSKVSATIKATGDSIVVGLFPFIEQILQWVLDNMPTIRDTITSVMDKIMPAVSTVLEAIMQALPPILDAFMAVVDALMPLLEPVLGAISSTVVALAESIGALLPPILEAFTTVVEALLPLLEPVLDGISSAVSAVTEVITALLPPILEAFTAVVDSLMPLLEPVLSLISGAISTLVDVIKAAIDFIQPYLEPIISSIQALVGGFISLLNGDITGFFEGIVSYFTGMISVVKDLGSKIFTGLWDGMKSIWTSISGWIEGVVSSITDWFSGIGASIAAFFGFGGEEDMDGSHAAGLPTVPYDGYKATLHRGETVLNANDTSKLAELLENGGGGNAPIYFTVQNIMDGRIIGENTYQYIRRKERAMG